MSHYRYVLCRVILICLCELFIGSSLAAMSGGLIYTNSGIVTNQMFKTTGDTKPIYYLEKLDSPGIDMNTGQYPYIKEAGRLVSPPLGIRSAVPLGGIGAGTIELRADGAFQEWQIFNNPGGKPAIEKTLFAVSTMYKGGQPKAWVLQTHPPEGLPGVDRITYRGAFPASKLDYADAAMPIDITLEAFSSFSPHDAKNSALPAAFFTFSIRNKLDKQVDACLLLTLENYIRGRFSTCTVKGVSSLTLERSGSERSSGSMSAGVIADGVSYLGGWSGLKELWAVFSTGKGLGPVPLNGDGGNAAICARVQLRAGQRKRVTLILTWYFPNDSNIGHQYANWFSSSEDALRYCAGNASGIRDKVEVWNKWCYDNDLPKWLRDCICNVSYPIFKTTFWRRDGKFRPLESFSCPFVAPVHLFIYWSPAYSQLFPDLCKQILDAYASFQQLDGSIQENLGIADLTIPSLTDRSEVIRTGFTDLCPEYILLVYQYYLGTGDKTFLDRHWPHVKNAMEWSLRACNDLGLPMRGGNTYDIFNYERFDTNTYVGMLHLASLMAMQRMAALEKEPELATTYRQALERGRLTIETHLWSGAFYRSYWIKDASKTNLCDADHLFGQMLAHVLGLGYVSSERHVRSSLNTIIRNDAKTTYGATYWMDAVSGQRYVGEEDDPQREFHVWFAHQYWPGACFAAAAEAIYQGRTTAGLNLAKKVYDNVALNVKDLWNWTDTYEADDGHPTCNSHYARQMVVWTILTAISGCHYDASEKSLSFAPVAEYRSKKLPFMTPSCYGFYIEDRDSITIEILEGKLDASKLIVSVPNGVTRLRTSDGKEWAVVAVVLPKQGRGSYLRLNGLAGGKEVNIPVNSGSVHIDLSEYGKLAKGELVIQFLDRMRSNEG